LFVGDPPLLVAIGRVYPTTSKIHIVPLHDDFARVVIEEVRHANAEVRLVGKAVGIFIVWPTHLFKAI